MKKNDLLPASAMAAELSAQRGRSKIYKEISDEHKAEVIGEDVRRKAETLRKHQDKVDLSDVRAVRERAQVYLDACAEAGTIPNVLGLSAYGFGCSRQWLNEYLRTHPKSQSAEYINLLKDSFADILVNASLGRAADPTMGIFVLKNCAGFRDRFEIEPVRENPDPLGETVDPEELRRRIEDNIVDDEWEDGDE